MTATTEQIRHELGRLIRLASGGQEIVITEDGLPVAKLVGICQQANTPDRTRWLQSLRELRKETSTGKTGRTTDELLTEDRAERS